MELQVRTVRVWFSFCVRDLVSIRHQDEATHAREQFWSSMWDVVVEGSSKESKQGHLFKVSLCVYSKQAESAHRSRKVVERLQQRPKVDRQVLSNESFPGQLSEIRSLKVYCSYWTRNLSKSAYGKVS